MMPLDKSDKHEIIISKITSDLIAYSSSELIRRGNELAGIILSQNSPLKKVENILLSLWAKKNDPLFRAEIAIALLELEKSTDSIAEEGIRLLDSEFSSDNNLPITHKRDLLQLLAKVGYGNYSSEYVLNLIRVAPADNSQISNTLPRSACLIYYAKIFNHSQPKHITELIEWIKKLPLPEKYTATEILGGLNCESINTIQFLKEVAQSEEAILRIQACEILISMGETEIARTVLNALIKSKDHTYDTDDAQVILGLLGETEIASQILLNKFQKASYISPVNVFKHLKYLAEFGKREESIAILLNFLHSLNSGKNDIPVLKKVSKPYEKTLDTLFDLSYKSEDLTHKLVNIATSDSIDTALRITALKALSHIEIISTNELEEIAAIASTPNKQKVNVSMYAAGTLCNFISTRRTGAELLIRLWKSYPFATTSARSAFENIEKCGNDPKIVDMLIEMAATPKLGTPLTIDACRAIIHIKKRN